MKKQKFLLLFMLLVSVCYTYAQEVTGVVIDNNGEPLIGATVKEVNSTNAAITDLNGEFTMTVSGLPTTLQASYVGYSPVSTDVTSSTPVTITLAEDANVLEEVVITGLATSVKRRNAANAVAVVSGENLTGATAQPTMDGALYGKFSGAELRSNSGAPGGGMSVRLRGVTSIFGDQQPLYVIDGVYIDNSSISSGTNIVSAAAGGGSTSVQDDASNRIADIDPEDIENIEILKGASAAAIYGSRAAGGVIIITTKKGKVGETKLSFGQDLGFASPITLLGDRGWTAQKVEDVYGAAERARYQQNGTTDYEKELYDNKPLQRTTRLEFSGGKDKTTYFLGGSLINNGGLVDNTGYDKKSIRFNLTQKLTNWARLDFNSNYIRSESDRGFFNNSNNNSTIGYAYAFTKPWDVLQPNEEGVYPANTGAGSNVLETIDLVTNRENTSRFIGGGSLNIDLFTKDNQDLRFVGRAGFDTYSHKTTSIFPQQLSYFRSPGSLGGVSINGDTDNLNTNISGFLVHNYYGGNGLEFTTQAGVTREETDFNSVIVTGIGLNGSQTNVDQSANTNVVQTQLPRIDKGFFVQEEVNIGDKVIGTIGLRGDKSTNNGDANKFYYHPKANLAVRFLEFDNFDSNFFDEIKGRIAYGQSARSPNFNSRFNNYNATFIGQNSGFITSTSRGNSEIEPELQQELEFGTDVSFLDSKYVLAATYYIKTIDDLLLNAQEPTSTGYVSKTINGGELENKGVELELTASPLNDNAVVKWNTGLRFWKNKSEITELTVPAFNLGGFAASLGQYRIEEGSSATQIVGTYNPADCGTPDCSDLDPNGDGFRVYGDAEPDFNLSWNNSLTYNNFDLNFLWHLKSGGEGINLSTLLYDLAGTTWDYDDTSLDPTGQLGNGDYRTSEWFAGNSSPWIEETGYLRLRELGLYYKVPETFLNGVGKYKFGVSGRNLVNIFDYNSYDPEVSNFGNNVLANTVEVVPFPSNKTVSFHIKATF